MISFDHINLTEGHIVRHIPAGSGAPGREAAIIDIAQDLLLSYLEDKGLMEHVSLKGGTAMLHLFLTANRKALKTVWKKVMMKFSNFFRF